MKTILALVSGLVVSAPCFGDLSSSMQSCYAIKTQKSKLDCYDKLARANLPPAPGPSQQIKSWDKEPDAFLGIRFGQPVTDSVSDCPTKSSPSLYGGVYVGVDWNAVKSSGKQVCFDKTDRDSKEHKYVLDPFLVKGFTGEVKIVADQSGNVVYVSAVTFAESWDYLSEVFINKYGPPLETKKGAMTLNNGSKLNSDIFMWLGKKVAMRATSLDDRKIRGGHIFDQGSVSVITNEYVDSLSETQKSEVMEAAGRL